MSRCTKNLHRRSREGRAVRSLLLSFPLLRDGEVHARPRAKPARARPRAGRRRCGVPRRDPRRRTYSTATRSRIFPSYRSTRIACPTRASRIRTTSPRWRRCSKRCSTSSRPTSYTSRTSSTTPRVLLEVLARRGVPWSPRSPISSASATRTSSRRTTASLCAGPANPAVNCLACHLKEGAQRSSTKRAAIARRPAGASVARHVRCTLGSECRGCARDASQAWCRISCSGR